MEHSSKRDNQIVLTFQQRIKGKGAELRDAEVKQAAEIKLKKLMRTY